MTAILGRIRPSSVLVRIIEARVSAGFPSPAEDYADSYLSLDKLVNVWAPSVRTGSRAVSWKIILFSKAMDSRRSRYFR